jgi:hypothetical protein
MDIRNVESCYRDALAAEARKDQCGSLLAQLKAQRLLAGVSWYIEGSLNYCWNYRHSRRAMKHSRKKTRNSLTKLRNSNWVIIFAFVGVAFVHVGSDESRHAAEQSEWHQAGGTELGPRFHHPDSSSTW